jgi:hypothetical protein
VQLFYGISRRVGFGSLSLIDRVLFNANASAVSTKKGSRGARVWNGLLTVSQVQLALLAALALGQLRWRGSGWSYGDRSNLAQSL